MLFLPPKFQRRFPAAAATLRFVLSGRGLALFLVLAALVAATYVVENTRGRDRWEAVAKKLKLTPGADLTEPFYPAPVPDRLNATRHPALAPARVPDPRTAGGFGYAIDLSKLDAIATPGIPADLSTIDTADPASVLDATAPFGRYLTLLEKAFERPHCHWFAADPFASPDEPDDRVPCIHSTTGTFERFAALTNLRTRAHLRLGEPAAAGRELATLVRFSQVTGKGPSLVSSLVNIAATQRVAPDVLELIGHPGWDDPSLAHVTGALENVATLDKIDRSLRRERDHGIQHLRHRDLDIATAGMPLTDHLIFGTANHVPQGWRDQNAANYANWWQDAVFAYYDRSTGRINPGPHPSLADFLSGPQTPYTYLANFAAPSIGSIFRAAAEAEHTIALLRVAAAVERHRLAHGNAPASLTELVPAYLPEVPTDPVTGHPVHYATDTDGRVTLATLDWDRTANPSTYATTLTLD